MSTITERINAIPYRICDHIHIQQIGDYTIYIDSFRGGHCVLHNNVYECIISGHTESGDGLAQYINSKVDRLIASRYIEPDLEKIRIGKSSVYIPRKKWKPATQLSKKEMKDMLSKEYHNPVFSFENIYHNQDVSAYEYLCERNALRVALEGYGIKMPLLWMAAGLFIYDEDFSNTGVFSTNFTRSMFDATIIPVLGDYKSNLDWDVIDAHLKKSLPVLVHVDIYHMPYERNKYYHFRHGSHVVILLEKSINGYIMLDWAHPSYYYGEITKEELTIARTSANEKDQASVFNGYPILATYRLLHLDRFSLSLGVQKYVKANLYKSVKSILEDNGILSFFGKACLTVPEWVSNLGHDGYSNAIESFFFLDLEIKFLCLYFEEMLRVDSCSIFQPEALLEKAVNIRKSAELLKNKLILALRRKKVISEDDWLEMLNKIKSSISEYCEFIIRLLKTVKTM